MIEPSVESTEPEEEPGSPSADCSSGETPGEATRRFSEALARVHQERNYVLSYVARRCRTTDDVVRRWLSGDLVPGEHDWFWLCRMCQDLQSSDFVRLWCAARDEAAVRDAGDVSRPDDRQDDRQDASPEVDRLPDPAPEARPAAAQVASTSTPSLEGAVPGRPKAEAARVQVQVQIEETVEYPCRITRGRYVRLRVPVDLTTADVERIAAFLRTQADDAY